ncbi:MAG: hypothetical protein F4Y38_00055 [Gemmatimonadetes bacterium]|nr:hypothetical protein [Gemmatimonadota bacterium]MYG83700.1 hypothetical protein [Gemmatimonadota bacterium]MYJ91073.1 hypothetical protein [Gemmatimonadota bacterium]
MEFPELPNGAPKVTERRPRPQMPTFVKALIVMMIGILAGGTLNFMLGDQGADTPAFAIYGGVLALVIYIVQARLRARKK